jgi:hypothetical protein
MQELISQFYASLKIYMLLASFEPRNIYVIMQGSILLLHVGIWDLLLCVGISGRLKEERARRG